MNLLTLPLCISFHPRKTLSTCDILMVQRPPPSLMIDIPGGLNKSQHLIILKAMIYYSKQIHSKISKGKIHMNKFQRKTALMFPRVLSQ